MCNNILLWNNLEENRKPRERNFPVRFRLFPKCWCLCWPQLIFLTEVCFSLKFVTLAEKNLVRRKDNSIERKFLISDSSFVSYWRIGSFYRNIFAAFDMLVQSVLYYQGFCKTGGQTVCTMQVVSVDRRWFRGDQCLSSVMADILLELVTASLETMRKSTR